MTDLIAGQIQIMFSSALQMVPIVQTGRLRGLGVTSASPTMVGGTASFTL